MRPAVSARDPRVTRAAELLRAPGDALAIDGPELIEAAIAEDVPIELVLAADPAAWAHVRAPVVPAARDAMRALGAIGQPAEVVAIAQRPRPGDPADAALVLAGVRDAGNVGSILRTAAALLCKTGGHDEFRRANVAMTPDCADPFSRRALRAAAGASLRHGLVAPIEALGQVPRPLVGAVSRGGELRPDAIPEGAAIVLGNERDGLSAAERRACVATVTIPADGFASLNVAAAAAILLYAR